MSLVHRWLERRLARQPSDPFDDGLPMPPPQHLVAVAGSPGRRWFSERGRIDAQSFRNLAARHGVDLAGPASVLDFGCGCGRVARWLAPQVEAAGGRFTGTDLNPQLVAWCARNLPGRYLRNRLRPPLDVPSSSIDLLYGYSVLTHLREAMSVLWLDEVFRVLRPSGVALLSFHDEGYAERFGPAGILARLEAEPYVVLNDAMQGSNYMSSWTTRRHFSAMAEPFFDVLEIVEGGDGQAIAVLRPRHDAAASAAPAAVRV